MNTSRKPNHYKLTLLFAQNTGWKSRLGLVLIGFSIIGMLMLNSISAAVPPISLQPETGTVSSPASVVSDAAAVGGKAVVFKGAPTGIDLSNALNVRILGAKGDGVTNDTAPIQQALTQAASSQRPVYIPAGTYLVSGRKAFNGALNFGSNTTIVGDGDSSVIKLAANQSSSGDYKIFTPFNHNSISNVTFTKLKIDGNGSQNLQPPVPPGAPGITGYAIWFYQGSNITINDCMFENMAGSNVLIFGHNTHPVVVSNAKVINNRFHNLGGGIPGNRTLEDHSTIYMQSDPGLVQGNTFWNDSLIHPSRPQHVVVTALEIHGSHTLVANNRVTNFTFGGNVVETWTDSIGNTWKANTFRGITNVALSIWSWPQHIHRDLTITENDIVMDYSLRSVNAGIACCTGDAPVQNLRVTNNTIGITPSFAPFSSVAILIPPQPNQVITGNKITN